MSYYVDMPYPFPSWPIILIQNAVVAGIALVYGSDFYEIATIYILESLAIAIFLIRFEIQRAQSRQYKNDRPSIVVYSMGFLAFYVFVLIQIQGASMLFDTECGFFCHVLANTLANSWIVIATMTTLVCNEYLYARTHYTQLLHRQYKQTSSNRIFKDVVDLPLMTRWVVRMLLIMILSAYYLNAPDTDGIIALDQFIAPVLFLFVANSIIDVFIDTFFNPKDLY